MRHRRHLGTTPARLSYRRGLSDEGRATASPTRSGALVANVHLGASEEPGGESSGRYAFTHRNGRHRVAGGVRRRRREADLKHPGANLIVVHLDARQSAATCTILHSASHEVSPWRSHPDPDEHLPAARRRVPALSVSVRAAILACRAHHPDHLEEEPAADPSLTRRARGKLSVEYSVIRQCNYKFQVMSKVSGPTSQVFTSSLRCQVYGVKSTESSLWSQVYGVKPMVSSPWCHVYEVSGPSESKVYQVQVCQAKSV